MEILQAKQISMLVVIKKYVVTKHCLLFADDTGMLPIGNLQGGTGGGLEDR